MTQLAKGSTVESSIVKGGIAKGSNANASTVKASTAKAEAPWEVFEAVILDKVHPVSCTKKVVLLLSIIVLIPITSP